MAMNHTAVGIDVGGSFIKSGIVSPAGQILYEAQVEETPPDGTEVVKAVRCTVGQMISKASAAGLPPIRAIGISSCGAVDSAQGIVLESVAIPNYDGIAVNGLI